MTIDSQLLYLIREAHAERAKRNILKNERIRGVIDKFSTDSGKHLTPVVGFGSNFLVRYDKWY